MLSKYYLFCSTQSSPRSKFPHNSVLTVNRQLSKQRKDLSSNTGSENQKAGRAGEEFSVHDKILIVPASVGQRPIQGAVPNPRSASQAFDNASRFSHLHGSSTFFLSQEASATRALIQKLGALYDEGPTQSWDRSSYAESCLFCTMTDVLQKFLQSEEKHGHLLDPNVWRNAADRGKVAVYCTAFAGVVVDILRIIGKLKPDQFAKRREALFPLLCKLIRSQSDEIRGELRAVFERQIGAALL